MKKEKVTIKVLLHPTQMKIIKAFRKGLSYENETLRSLARKIKVKESPQLIKHHLDHLVNLGVFDKIQGNYLLSKDNK